MFDAVHNVGGVNFKPLKPGGGDLVEEHMVRLLIDHFKAEGSKQKLYSIPAFHRVRSGRLHPRLLTSLDDEPISDMHSVVVPNATIIDDTGGMEDGVVPMVYGDGVEIHTLWFKVSLMAPQRGQKQRISPLHGMLKSTCITITLLRGVEDRDLYRKTKQVVVSMGSHLSGTHMFCGTTIGRSAVLDLALLPEQVLRSQFREWGVSPTSQYRLRDHFAARDEVEPMVLTAMVDAGSFIMVMFT